MLLVKQYCVKNSGFGVRWPQDQALTLPLAQTRSKSPALSDSVPHLFNEELGGVFGPVLPQGSWGLPLGFMGRMCRLRLHTIGQSVWLSLRGWGNRTRRIRKMDLISCCFFSSVPVSCNEICRTTLHTCDCLLSVRSKCGNTNELAFRSETNPDNAVRNCQRNPPKKQEQSLQGQPDSKCSSSNSRGNLCPRWYCGAGFKGAYSVA